MRNVYGMHDSAPDERTSEATLYLCPVCGEANAEHWIAGTMYLCGDRRMTPEEIADLDEALTEEG